MTHSALARYQRQMIFPGLGEAGQQRLLDATAVVIGCGATGTALSNQLARMGVGRLRIVDRDFIELNNLQRQILFDQDDIDANLPKAEAAARKLRAVNRDIEVEGIVADVNAGNVIDLIRGATVVLDGTDNFSTRYLLNDACVKLGIAWVYTGVIASYGMTATFVPDGAAAALPGERTATGCLRCLLGEMPPPGASPSCDTAGVIGPGVALITAVSAAEAMKLMTGRGELNPGLLHMDVWDHEYEILGSGVRRSDCKTCARHEYEFLDAQVGVVSSSLCGRNAVQVQTVGAGPLDLASLARRLESVARSVRRNDYLIKAEIDGYQWTIFPDNRAIIKGTADEDAARSLYARYIGG
ncbi:MAG: ThiF family adenylyltransferase [Caldilineaceae bacterium]|nr:ThiF family adenylyltransferase [Caldilineaceae bacterium]